MKRNVNVCMQNEFTKKKEYQHDIIRRLFKRID